MIKKAKELRMKTQEQILDKIKEISGAIDRCIEKDISVKALQAKRSLLFWILQDSNAD